MNMGGMRGPSFHTTIFAKMDVPSTIVAAPMAIFKFSEDIFLTVSAERGGDGASRRRGCELPEDVTFKYEVC